MKRVIQVIAIYTVIIFGLCIGMSFLYGHLPTLLAPEINEYVFSRGMLWFLTILPAIVISGFMVGCAIQWKNNTENSREKYSTAMGQRFQKVIIIGIVITAVLTFTAEIFVPQFKHNMNNAEENPALLNKYLYLGRVAANEGHATLAFQYAEQAYKIYPEDKAVAEFYKESTDAKDIEISSDQLSEVAIPKIIAPIEDANRGYTIKEMLEKSQTAADEKKWFDSHYWATLALTACGGTDTNLSAVQNAANKAWNELNNPVKFDNEKEEKLFATKKEGYSNLTRGDNLKAYYIFKELDSNIENKNDPDIKQYLAISEERVKNEYFFIDETNELKKLKTQRNIFFSISNPDGSNDVVSISGDLVLKDADSMIRYLEGLTIVSFDKYGNFKRSMCVPFAKMLEVPSSIFSETELTRMGISKKTKTIPYILLQSIDRNTEGIVSRPTYSYSATGLPYDVASKFLNMEKIRKIQSVNNDYSSIGNTAQPYLLDDDFDEPNSVILPMPYSDFDLLDSASKGAEVMPYPSLVEFVSKSNSYGYSKEVYAQDMLKRGVYPLFILIIIIFSASFAWNYRLGAKEIFQFKWLFLFPLFSFVVYIVLECCQYIFTLLNYLIVCLCGSYSLIIAAIAYIVILISVSIQFLARRSS
ncbi:MAG: hypothetical protein WCQ67_03850 [Treponema sp.]